MSEFFLRIVNMSISAGWVVLVLLLLRQLLKKAPKWISVLLWGIVAVRAVCPFSFESVVSLIPSAQTISPEIMLESAPSVNTGISIIDSAVNPVIMEFFAPEPGASANPLQVLIPIMSVIWLVGIAVMLVYTGLSVCRIRRRIGIAVHLSENVYQSENVVSPFVFGIAKPKIYLPFSIKAQDVEHVIAHENAHIRRKDYWWKPFGFLILTLHWFNPLLWLGYVLLCRDIELACDEKVIRELNSEQKADYSQALLACSVNRRLIAACPLAFGEVGVKERVKSVLNYKKPSFWIIITAILASAALAVCFLTNPKDGLEAVSHQKSGSELLGLSLEIVSLETSAPDPCMTIRYKNKTSDQFVFGEEQHIYRKVNGAWEDCWINPSDVWSLVGNLLAPKASTTHTYGLNGKATNSFDVKTDVAASNIYGSYVYDPNGNVTTSFDTKTAFTASNISGYVYALNGNMMTEPGEYRFETEFFIEGKPETKYKTWIEFELTRGVDR